MDHIVDQIIQSYGNDFDSDFLEVSRTKVRNYIELIAANFDEQMLADFGKSYIEELTKPDPRYSGC